MSKKKRKRLRCPYRTKQLQMQQTAYSYIEDSGQVEQITTILLQKEKQSKCLGKQCAAWRQNGCQYFK